MKKYLLLVVAALLATANINAQTKLVRFGAEAGLNVNKLSLSSDVFSSSNRCGFFVGPKMLVKIPLVGLGADVAILYNNNGASRSEYTTTDASGQTVTIPESSHNLSYITIPVNLRYDVSFLKIMGAYIATGPQFSYCMNGSGTMTELYGSEYNRSSWAWNIGAGLKFVDHLHLGFTYSIPINSVSLSGITEGLSAKQKTFTVRLAYIF